MSGETYYQRNKGVILNRAKDYYGNNKKLLRKREQKINIGNYLKKENRSRGSTKEADITCLMKRKKELKEYQRNYCETKKSA